MKNKLYKVRVKFNGDIELFIKAKSRKQALIKSYESVDLYGKVTHEKVQTLKFK
jgi:hypothetical protein